MCVSRGAPHALPCSYVPLLSAEVSLPPLNKLYHETVNSLSMPSRAEELTPQPAPVRRGRQCAAARLQAALAVSSSARPPAAPSPAASRSSLAPSPVSARMAGGRGEALGRPAAPDGGVSARTPDGVSGAAAVAAAAAAADAGTRVNTLGTAQRCAPGGDAAASARVGAGTEERDFYPSRRGTSDPAHARAGSLRRASARLGAAVKLPGKPPPDSAALHADGLQAVLAEVCAQPPSS